MDVESLNKKKLVKLNINVNQTDEENLTIEEKVGMYNMHSEKYLKNIIKRLDELHLKDLTDDELNAVEIIKRYLNKADNNIENAHKLKVSSSEFLVVCPNCEGHDVFVETEVEKWDEYTSDTIHIKVECNECKHKGFIDSV